MTDRPIIFSAPMVRALLEGRKTQTRRLIKPQPIWDYGALGIEDKAGRWIFCANTERGFADGLPRSRFKMPYAPGDRLYVRETWSAMMNGGWTIADARRRMFNEKIVYRADGRGYEEGDGWWSSIHMPREFSRLTLTVTEVRVQRLQGISAEDCTAEGIPFEPDALAPAEWSISRFADLWNSLHAPDAWDANPWVVALTFTVQHGNIDQIGGEA